MAAAQIIRCACGCGQPIGEAHIGAFRAECARSLLREIQSMQQRMDGERIILTNIFYSIDALHHAQALAGPLPFVEKG